MVKISFSPVRDNPDSTRSWTPDANGCVGCGGSSNLDLRQSQAQQMSFFSAQAGHPSFLAWPSAPEHTLSLQSTESEYAHSALWRSDGMRSLPSVLSQSVRRLAHPTRKGDGETGFAYDFARCSTRSDFSLQIFLDKAELQALSRTLPSPLLAFCPVNDCAADG